MHTVEGIEQNVRTLSRDEQLRLIARVVENLRGIDIAGAEFDRQLAAMAADPDVQRELALINGEFRGTELDGLVQ